MVSYSGRPPGQPVYRCERQNQMLGVPRCFTFGGLRIDAAVSRELLRAVERSRSRRRKRPNGDTWKLAVNNSEPWNWSCNGRLGLLPRDAQKPDNGARLSRNPRKT